MNSFVISNLVCTAGYERNPYVRQDILSINYNLLTWQAHLGVIHITDAGLSLESGRLVQLAERIVGCLFEFVTSSQ